MENNNIYRTYHLSTASKLARLVNQDGLESIFDSEYLYVSDYFAKYGINDIDALVKISHHLELVGEKETLARILVLIGIYCFGKKMNTQGEANLNRALAIFYDLDWNCGEIYTYLGNLAVNQFQFRKAIRYYIAAKGAFQELDDIEKVAQVSQCVANCLWQSGELEKAIEELQFILEIYNQEAWNPVQLIFTIAKIKLDAFCYKEAMQDFEIAEKLSVKSNTLEDKIRIAHIYYFMGVCLRNQENDSLSSEKVLRMALTMYRALALDATKVYYELSKVLEKSDFVKASKFTNWYLISKIPQLLN